MFVYGFVYCAVLNTVTFFRYFVEQNALSIFDEAADVVYDSFCSKYSVYFLVRLKNLFVQSLVICFEAVGNAKFEVLVVLSHFFGGLVALFLF